MDSWRLLVDGNLRGAHNMARDMAILNAVAAGAAPPSLRLYGWDPPCLSLGKHQAPEAADLDFCRRQGIDVVRRPTGGRALLHHLELTYTVVAPLGMPPLPSALQAAYRFICSALVEACHTLGIDAQLTGGEVNLRLPNPTSHVPCFEAPAEGEVVVGGRKLIGSAMRAHGGCILQHGAILLDWDGRLQAGALGLTSDTDLRRHVATLSDELSHLPSREVIEQAVIAAMIQTLDVAIQDGALTDQEARAVRDLEPDFRIS